MIDRRLSVLLVLTCGLAIASTARGQQPTLEKATPPVYPPAALAAGIDGKVLLRGTIGKDGKMRDLHVLSGPPELQQAAIDTVMKWAYKPYKHFGKLVEVDTTVTVNFSLGTPAQKAAAQAKAKAKLAEAGQQAQTQYAQPPPAAKQETEAPGGR